jgi:hypothetical protein
MKIAKQNLDNVKASLKTLSEYIDEEGVTITHHYPFKSALVTWPDGSSGLMRWTNGQWQFAPENKGYQAGYAYACGYHD